ncbi:carbohydrate esterase family 16 protein [Auriscalpium vulgare]|uniref:Carbohydrate esterase family 16 protein n=1 Tax=Auriscalpium vulgare TaxID=40419 RepID=A0ACB8RUW8_9AGAM|nr:carbohydrate esterase family 16 protein [Auriscalpium vulgare]
MAPIKLVLLQTLALLAAAVPSLAAHGPVPGQIKNLVTFGDSYTDVVAVSNGGTQWPVYAAGYAGANLFPYARSGAPCSQLLTPRPFPGVVQDEIPLYLADLHNGSIHVPPGETLYTLWIGTNDIGPNTLLTGTDVLNNATIVDVTECAVGWVSTLYKAGARNFLFQNLLPEERLPLYTVDSWPNRYWDTVRNTTAWHLSITELTAAYNAIAKLLLAALPATHPGAHIGLFDSYGLFTDILNRPAAYLNGTAPLNTTGAVHACVFQEDESTSDPGTCFDAEGSARDSFIWFDELHPSEQADRVVAREIANVIEGKDSKWASWFS